MDAVTPRGPNLKLRKKLKREYNDGQEFNKLVGVAGEDEMEEGEMEIDEGDQEPRTVQVGDQNFTFSFK